MRLLLDTHVLVWWAEDNPRLGQRARALIADSRADALMSIASCWEASIKARKGKVSVTGSDLWQMGRDEGFGLIGLERGHIAALEGLPRIPGHEDPFDHLLLAQAKAEVAALMTADRILTRYGVPCVGVR